MQNDHEHTGVLPHTVVIGGGLAGLTAAAYLARAGHCVTLFEKAPQPGGRAATRLRAGFAFNLGIHAIYTGGATTEVLADLGVTYSAGSPRDTFVLDGGRLAAFPASPLALLRSRLLSLGDKVDLMRVFAGLATADAHAVAGESVEAWLARLTRRPRVRRLLAALARTLVYSSGLDLVSAEVLVDKLQRTLKHPVHYVDGGWQTLVDGMRRVATGAGARLVTGVRVDAVECHGGRATGVRLRDGNLVHASSVILATPPRDAAALVAGGPGGAALHQAVESLVPGYLACLDVALRKLPHPETPVVQDLDRPLFCSAQSRYARIAPEGAALVHAFKQLDPRQPADPGKDERDLESLLDQAQPGWRDEVVQRVALPHMLAVGALPTAGGGGFAGRPGPRVPDVSGLYLAGDWVGPVGFLADAAFASAREAARLALQGAAATPNRPLRVGVAAQASRG